MLQLRSPSVSPRIGLSVTSPSKYVTRIDCPSKMVNLTWWFAGLPSTTLKMPLERWRKCAGFYAPAVSSQLKIWSRVSTPSVRLTKTGLNSFATRRTRALPLSELVTLIASARIEIESFHADQLTPDVETWLAVTQTRPEVADRVREHLERDRVNDLSGLSPFLHEGRMFFTQRTVAIVGRKLSPLRTAPAKSMA